MGTGGSFPAVKRSGREANHSPPSTAEVKNAWSYNSTPQYVFMAWCLVKHRDIFTCIFYLPFMSISPKWSPPLRFLNWNFECITFFFTPCYMFLSQCFLFNNRAIKSVKPSLCYFLRSSVTSFFSVMCSEILYCLPMFFPRCDTHTHNLTSI
jgi:hypothetical protein